ncbi:hypothetical protein PV326_009904 [Microctonus aethiopoides]|uniref:Uncharacterized protein n=1 Tax=Microctonus aethiopoides TaxID=144406 RepID=A0AA39F8M4_9HYME|nr:hypothetical protein PV326_009904 [Microctonus aethiopoides]KAK0164908.1 hypothetical protein PV328_003475 [Microctonus aethiopoides]
MKLLYTIVLTWMFIAIESKNLDKKLSFEKCDHDGWKVQNISIVRTADKINFTANIANSTSEKIANTSYEVKFLLSGCSENFTCTNFTNLASEHSDCTGNRTEYEKEKCTVIKIIEDWARESTNLKVSRENKNPRNGCVLYETLLNKSQSTQKPEGKIHGLINGLLHMSPLSKHDPLHPSIIL